MSEEHFARLQRALDLEAEAEAREALGQSRGDGQTDPTGRRLSGLVIRDESAGFAGRILLVLGKRDRSLDLPWNRFSSGTPVVLVEEHGKAAHPTRGVVTRRDPQTITVAVNDVPETHGDRPTFTLSVSSDEIARTRQRDALRRLARSEIKWQVNLRARLVGDEQPTFAERIPWTPLSPLDATQIEAVDHALAAEQIAVIHGPPGTGKTTAVVELIRQAIRRGQRVLACAASNLAVDNLLERLVAYGEKALRIGHPARVLPELQAHTLDVQVENHPDLKLAREWTKSAWTLRRQAGKFLRTAPQPGARREMRDEANQLLEDARRVEQNLVDHLIDSATVICATLTGLDGELLRQREFDLVVIDEAAQATEPPCWIPLLRARKVVLAGDHCQLPPTILSHDARRAGLHVSLMERLVDQWGPVVSRRLGVQYRMHSAIMEFSSDEFYDGQLTAAESVQNRLLTDLAGVQATSTTLAPLRFIDTAGSDCVEEAEAVGASRQNPGEADVVAQQVAELLETGVLAEQIAVITPYSGQVKLLRQLIPNESIEIDTVDGFQGREKEAVILSLVRSNPKGELGFLTDTRRMNVALTRARSKLIAVGDSSTLANHEFYMRLLEYFELQEAYGSIWELDMSS